MRKPSGCIRSYSLYNVTRKKKNRVVREKIGDYSDYDNLWFALKRIKSKEMLPELNFSALEIVDDCGNAVKASNAIPPKDIGNPYIP